MTRRSPSRVLARWSPRLAPLGLIVGLALTACPDDVELVRTIPAGCEVEPVFELLSPNPDGTQEFDAPGTMDVHVDVGNFSIVSKAGQANEPCEGHFHVSVDGGAIFVMTTTLETRDISDLEEGPHTISITVHNNDHSRIEEIDAFGTTFLVDVETN